MNTIAAPSAWLHAGHDAMMHDDLVLKKTSPRILVIDDDPEFLKFFETYGKMSGYEVDTFECFSDISWVGNLASYDVAVVDFQMPLFNGAEIASYIEKLSLDLPFILISGHDFDHIHADFPEVLNHTFYSKSWGIKGLLAEVSKLTAPV